MGRKLQFTLPAVILSFLIISVSPASAQDFPADPIAGSAAEADEANVVAADDSADPGTDPQKTDVTRLEAIEINAGATVLSATVAAGGAVYSMTDLSRGRQAEGVRVRTRVGGRWENSRKNYLSLADAEKPLTGQNISTIIERAEGRGQAQMNSIYRGPLRRVARSAGLLDGPRIPTGQIEIILNDTQVRKVVGAGEVKLPPQVIEALRNLSPEEVERYMTAVRKNESLPEARKVAPGRLSIYIDAKGPHAWAHYYLKGIDEALENPDAAIRRSDLPRSQNNLAAYNSGRAEIIDAESGNPRVGRAGFSIHLGHQYERVLAPFNPDRAAYAKMIEERVAGRAYGGYAGPRHRSVGTGHRLGRRIGMPKLGLLTLVPGAYAAWNVIATGELASEAQARKNEDLCRLEGCAEYEQDPSVLANWRIVPKRADWIRFSAAGIYDGYLDWATKSPTTETGSAE